MLCFSMAPQPKSGPSCFIVEISRSHTIRHTHTHTHTHTHIRTPLKKWSVRRRDYYLHTTHQTQETKVHAVSGIRTLEICNQTVADPRLSPQNHRIQQPDYYYTCLISGKELMKQWQGTLFFKVLWQQRDMAWGQSASKNNAACILTCCCFCH